MSYPTITITIQALVYVYRFRLTRFGLLEKILAWTCCFDSVP